MVSPARNGLSGLSPSTTSRSTMRRPTVIASGRAGGVNARAPRMNSRPVMRNIAGSLWGVGLETLGIDVASHCSRCAAPDGPARPTIRAGLDIDLSFVDDFDRI